jgi:hypothetical protein
MTKYILTLSFLISISCSSDFENGIEIKEVEIQQEFSKKETDPGELRKFEIINNSAEGIYYERTKNNKMVFPTSRLNFANGDTIPSIIDRSWTEYEFTLIKPFEVDTIRTFLHYNYRNEDSSRIGFTFFNEDSVETEFYITLTNLKK